MTTPGDSGQKLCRLKISFFTCYVVQKKRPQVVPTELPTMCQSHVREVQHYCVSNRSKFNPPKRMMLLLWSNSSHFLEAAIFDCTFLYAWPKSGKSAKLQFFAHNCFGVRDSTQISMLDVQMANCQRRHCCLNARCPRRVSSSAASSVRVRCRERS